MREQPHLELERELQRLSEELQRDRPAHSEDQRNVRRLERDLRELQQTPKKGPWTNTPRSNNH